jgi:hypothetical protein
MQIGSRCIRRLRMMRRTVAQPSGRPVPACAGSARLKQGVFTARYLTIRSDLRHAAVHEDLASGHETTDVGRKKERDGSCLLGKSHAPEGCLGDQARNQTVLLPDLAKPLRRPGVVVAPGESTFTRIPDLRNYKLLFPSG